MPPARQEGPTAAAARNARAEHSAASYAERRRRGLPSAVGRQHHDRKLRRGRAGGSNALPLQSLADANRDAGRRMCGTPEQPGTKMRDREHHETGRPQA
eukprot:11971817-Alexandrium_andersonii.AAC.1